MDRLIHAIREALAARDAVKAVQAAGIARALRRMPTTSQHEDHVLSFADAELNHRGRRRLGRVSTCLMQHHYDFHVTKS
jgi:hypothetical protein